MANDEMNLNEILKIRREKLEQLKEMGRNPFEILKYDQTHHSKDIKDNFEEMEERCFHSRRIMSFRDMGKASFCDIQDRYGRIQAYIKQDELGEE
jgi:lysyl-tRNA synthetase class 2